MKLLEITNMLPALNSLAAQKIPVKAGYRIAKTLNMIKPDLAAYEEQRTKLLQEFGTLSEDRGSYNFTNANSLLFQVAHQALLEEEVVFLVLPTIKLSELGELSIEPLHLAALSSIIIEDDVAVPMPPQAPGAPTP